MTLGQDRIANEHTHCILGMGGHRAGADGAERKRDIAHVLDRRLDG